MRRTKLSFTHLVQNKEGQIQIIVKIGKKDGVFLTFTKVRDNGHINEFSDCSYFEMLSSMYELEVELIDGEIVES